MTQELLSVIGPTGSDAIKQMLQAAGTAEPTGWAGLVGIAVLIFAAAGFFGSHQDALDTIWEAPAPPEGIWSFIKTKLFSFSLVLAAAFLLLVTLVLSSALAAFAGSLANATGLPAWALATAIAIGNFLLSVLIFAAIFKFVPSVNVTWRAAAAGGIFTAILFVFALAWYLGRQAEASAYGRSYFTGPLADLGLLLSADSVPRCAVLAKLSRGISQSRLRQSGAGQPG